MAAALPPSFARCGLIRPWLQCTLKFGLWIALVLSLAACGAIAPKSDKHAHTAHQSKLEALKKWQLSGKIGFRSPDEAVSAAINYWRQRDQHYRIALSSTFLGLGAMELRGTPDYVMVMQGDDPPVISYAPDELLTELIGAPLPIRYLPWWIKGLPADEASVQKASTREASTPTASPTIEYNEQGLPSSIEQFGWHIHYASYTENEGLLLPRKMTLSQDDIRIKLVISGWQFE